MNFTQNKKLKYYEMAYLTEEEIKYMINNEERKFGCEESKKPLGGIHVGSKTEVHEVIKQIWQLLLQVHSTTSASSTIITNGRFSL